MRASPGPRNRRGSFRRGFVLGLAGTMMAALLPLAAIAELRAQSVQIKGVFNSTEKRSDNLKPFPKWTKVLDRYIEERKKREGSCEETKFNKCHYQRWRKLIESVRGKSVRAQLKAVNNYANKVRYVLDPINWGVRDYWATPGQFFQKFGDCEDYAIVKFMTLRALGFDPASLRVVVVQDMSLRVAHGILAVYQDGKILILDNQMTLVVEDRRIRHYRPIYSLNEQAWWRHKVVRAKSRTGTTRRYSGTRG